MTREMTIAVTGALGHIGSRLIRALPANFPQARIILIDNLCTQRYASLFHLPTDGRFRFVEADVLTDDLPALFDEADAVIHLAALTDAAGSFAIKEELEQKNFDATRKVADACVEAGAALFFPSSTSVYGTQTATVDELCPITDLRPQSPYANTKLREEELLCKVGESKGLRFVIGRLGTIFGPSPGMRFHTAVNKFCWQAVRGQAVTVWRTALHQVRPYLDLSDAVRAIEFILRNDVFDGQIYNVLTLNATVHQVLESIREHVADLGVELVDHEIMNQLSYDVENSRFRALGFEYEGCLSRGIAETIDLLRACSSLANSREGRSRIT